MSSTIFIIKLLHVTLSAIIFLNFQPNMNISDKKGKNHCISKCTYEDHENHLLYFSYISPFLQEPCHCKKWRAPAKTTPPSASS